VLPVATLYQGLYELSSALCGYLVPHHIEDVDVRTPGLLSGIAQLRELTAAEDTSLISDILWAQNELATARRVHTTSLQLRGLIANGAHQSYTSHAIEEWQATVDMLESMRP